MPGGDTIQTSGGSEARICPQCGTRNTGLSLFCAECGTALFDIPEEDATQTTAVFTPSLGPRATDDDPQETMSSAPMWSPAPPVPSWPAPATMRESRRGLVLGWTASVLIALVVGFVVWATILSAGTRDMVIGWFT